MFCTNCGKEIQEGSAFCPECGAKKPEKNTWDCPNCGNKGIDAKFCPVRINNNSFGFLVFRISMA